MQASHLEVHQGGSHFGHVEASNSQIFQGNFYGLTINPTATAQVAPGSYEGHYAHLSLRPVPNFVSRPRLHQKIKAQLHNLNDNERSDVRILVVYGLGGAGKSQLVLNYIREYRRDYTAVFWIEAESKESIERDYKSYIDLDYFIPNAPRVHIIITSRSSTAKEITTLDAVEVADIKPPEAIELFQRCAKIREKGQDIATEVAQIVKELGHLALAITLAGSYVLVTPRLSSDIGRYLPEYRERRKELLQRRAKRHIHQYGESVLSTWEASFEAIKNHNPGAARLLSLLTFVNFEDIFLGLFDRDGAGVFASAPSRVAEPSETITSSNKTWQSFLFSG